MVVESQKETAGVIAPAISVFPWSTENQGLKISTSECSDLHGCLIEMYEISDQKGSVEDWIGISSYDHSEILFDTTLGWIRLQSLNDFWVEDVTQSSFGRFYTLELGKRLGSSIDEDQLWIHLLHNATYYIEVHDGNFYLGFMNPNLPLEYALVTTGGEPSFYWFFKTTEVEHLNLPSRPCNPSPGYNFQVYRF